MCSGNSYLKIPIKSKNAIIAVLPFSGVGVSQNTKHLLADELTNFIFIDKKIPVVDRSQVNFLLNQTGIDNPYSISKQQIIQISDSLDATIIALGFISKKSILRELENSLNSITITVRFLDGKSATVMGIIHGSQKLEEVQFDIIRNMLREMIGKI
jgi:hypothetical protein